MSKVLICYYTKTGSTKEVAEKVGGILGEKGHEVDIKPLEMVGDIKEYKAVIIGAPINGMTWKTEALEFVKAKANELKEKKVAYFTLGLLAYQGRKMWQNSVINSLAKPSKIVSPIDTAVFGGVGDPNMPGIMRFIFGIAKDAKIDQRDWDIIENWANSLAFKL